MHKIETILESSDVARVEGHLRALGIKRITALEVTELGDDTSSGQRELVYRGTSVRVPRKRVQLQVLASEVEAANAVAALRALSQAGQIHLDEVLLYPVGTPTNIAALKPVAEALAVSSAAS
jgi:nitrogen regulatory protein PII